MATSQKRTHDMGNHVRLPLTLEPQPEGGFTITSPLVPELITEADTLADVMPNVLDAWRRWWNSMKILGALYQQNCM